MGTDHVAPAPACRTVRDLIHHVAASRGIDRRDVDLGAFQRTKGPGAEYRKVLNAPISSYDERQGAGLYALYHVKFMDGASGSVSFSTYRGMRSVGVMTTRLRVDFTPSFGKRLPTGKRSGTLAEVEDARELESGEIRLGPDPLVGRIARSSLTRYDDSLQSTGGDERESDAYLGGDRKPHL